MRCIKIERNAKPERRNDFNPVIDIDSLFEGIEQSQAVSKSYVSENRLRKEKENRKLKRKVLIQFKERLLASCGRDASSYSVITQSGEREIDSQRFLYLCLREFRAAQRRFKRNVRETLKVADLSSGYDAITEGNFQMLLSHWFQLGQTMKFR